MLQDSDILTVISNCDMNMSLINISPFVSVTIGIGMDERKERLI